jgi:hypothetical protein
MKKPPKGGFFVHLAGPAGGSFFSSGILPPLEGGAAAGKVPYEDDGNDDGVAEVPYGQRFAFSLGHRAIEERGADTDYIADQRENAVEGIRYGEGIKAENKGEAEKKDEKSKDHKAILSIHGKTP